MKYRAKVTYIQEELEYIYQSKEPVKLKDVHDVYVEVDTEEEAELLEIANKYRKLSSNVINKLFKLIN